MPVEPLPEQDAFTLQLPLEPLPELDAKVPSLPVSPTPELPASAHESAPPEADTVISFPGEDEKPPQEEEQTFSLQNAWLTPRRMRLIFVLALLVVLFSVLMNSLPRHRRHRSTATMTPIPLETDQQPVSLDRAVPAGQAETHPSAQSS